jgi:hypothetical protein
MDLNRMALSATLHCLTGCAIGEVAGLVIGSAIGLSNGATVALAFVLAFLTGYALSTLPLLRNGIGVGRALRLVLAADTLSILVMEARRQPGRAGGAGCDGGRAAELALLGFAGLALAVAFVAAYPVNRWLLARGGATRSPTSDAPLTFTG